MTENTFRWAQLVIAAVGLALLIWIKVDVAEMRGELNVVTAHVNAPGLHAGR